MEELRVYAISFSCTVITSGIVLAIAKLIGWI